MFACRVPFQFHCHTFEFIQGHRVILPPGQVVHSLITKGFRLLNHTVLPTDALYLPLLSYSSETGNYSQAIVVETHCTFTISRPLHMQAWCSKGSNHETPQPIITTSVQSAPYVLLQYHTYNNWVEPKQAPH